MQDINLYHLLQFYAKRWTWFVWLTAIGALLGFAYSSYVQTPLFKSDATLIIISTDDRKVGQDSTLINNYVELIKSRRVLEPVIRNISAGITYDELASSTTASNEKNTEVIKVAISSKSPETSKILVDGVVSSFRDEVKDLYDTDNISVVDYANQATEPYNIRTVLTSVLLAAAGPIVTAIALFFVYDFSLGRPAKTTKKTQAKSKTGKSRKQGKIYSALQSARQKAASIVNRVAQPQVKPTPAKKPAVKKRVVKPAAKKATTKPKSTTTKSPTKTAKTSTRKK